MPSFSFTSLFTVPHFFTHKSHYKLFHNFLSIIIFVTLILAQIHKVDAGTCGNCSPSPGEYCASNNNCNNCAVGYYQPNADQNSCIACAVGYYQPSTGQSACLACAWASGNSTTVTASTSCAYCGIGSYINNTSKGCVACTGGNSSVVGGCMGTQSSCCTLKSVIVDYYDLGNRYSPSHTFSVNVGSNPILNGIHSDNKINLASTNGGTNDCGVLWRLKQDWTGIDKTRVLAGATDGCTPAGGAVEDGGSDQFYGCTTAGGTYGFGTLYAQKHDFATWSVLYHFKDETEAIAVRGIDYYTQSTLKSLFLATTANTIINITALVAANALITSPSDVTAAQDFSLRTPSYTSLIGNAPDGGLITAGDNLLYGVTNWGGSSNCGSVFRMSPLNLTGFTTIYNFQCRGDGSWPIYGVVATGLNTLIGITREGGANGFGTIYSMTLSGGSKNTLYSFTGGNDGAYPQFLLYVSAKNGVYICTSPRGSASATLVKWSTSSSTLTVIQTFGGVYGDYCNSLAVDGQSSPGPYMWGSSYTGGTGGAGVVWRIVSANY